jgi:hypothetical protein
MAINFLTIKFHATREIVLLIIIFLNRNDMESKIYLTKTISSILAFALIAAAVIPTAFENVLEHGENMIGMSRDQTTGGESTVFNPENIIKKEARGL